MPLIESLKPLQTDRRFRGDEVLGECLCSRCNTAIDSSTIPIWLWTEGGEWMWRYHPKCVGIEDKDGGDLEEEYDTDDVRYWLNPVEERENDWEYTSWEDDLEGFEE